MKRTLISTVCLIVCCLAATSLEAQEAKRTQRYALLIGVNDYAPPLGKLEFCHNDMRELRLHFAAAGFPDKNITFMEDQAEDSALRPSKSNIDKQLELRLQLANPDDIVVVAFSGHGLLIEGKSFLCPSDARIDSNDSLISIDSIYEQMEKCRASQKVLIIDACRNEPIVRGFKSGRLADDLAIEVQAPPKGLVVLSSCEAKQFSAEDAKLQHGVFMYYVMQGLKGEADTDAEIGGNKNGRVSLDELYFYAHEKTKSHVASSHRIVQRPVLKGEMVGRFELALVPDTAKLRELTEKNRPDVTTSKPADVPGDTRTVDHPLLTQADAFLRQADYENAIRAYTAIVDDTGLANEIRIEARKNRGAAYLARAGKTDIDKALIDQLAAGLSGVRMTVRAATADLKVSSEVRGKVKRNQTVLITKIAGDWLWVESVDGSDKLTGYLQRSAVETQPDQTAMPINPTAASQPASPATNNNRRPSVPAGADDFTRRYMEKHGRPPGVMETPRWESPAEIQRLRQMGLLR